MLKDKETRALVDFTNKFFGLDISEDLKPIALSELKKFKKTHKISDLAELLNNFQYDFQNEKILSLLDIFLIPHTSFFRNNRQFEVLKKEVIPGITSFFKTSNCRLFLKKLVLSLIHI